jgi:hypothetical protein
MGLPTLTRSGDPGTDGTRARPGSRSGSDSRSDTAGSTGSADRDPVFHPRRPVRRRAARFWNDALTTPGRMSVFAVLAVVTVLIGGIVASQTITQRQSHHETLLAEVEPVANASQTLYSSLTPPSSPAG